MNVRSPKDLLAGVGFVVFGGSAAGVALLNYEVGSAIRMGPAYFPVVLGAVLVLLGAIVIVRAMSFDGPRIGAWHARPLFAVVGGCVLYGYAVRPFGIVLATTVLVFACSLAGGWIGWRRIGALAAVLSLFAVGVFVMGLGMALPVWPSLFD